MNSMETSVASHATSLRGLPSAHRSEFLQFLNPPRRFPVGKELAQDDEGSASAYLLLEGWMCSYRVWPHGGRQIVDFKIPGDTVGLRNLSSGESSLYYSCITDVIVSQLKSNLLEAHVQHSPELAASIFQALAREEVMLEEHLLNLGRHTATARMAHLLLELGERLRLVGLASADSYRCPLTQAHLADALGLTTIHVNRTLRTLREQGLLTLRGGVVRFLDRRALTELCDFDSSYIRARSARRSA